MRPHLTLILSLVLASVALAAAKPVPIHIAVQWHMHQPIYWPGEDLVATSHNPGNTLDVIGFLTWPDRVGAYTHYTADSIGQLAKLPHAGAQVSFSGSLIEDLDALAKANITYAKDWAARTREARGWRTAGGNPRLDLVGFGYYHPLMAFLEPDEIREAVKTHREAVVARFGGPASRGLFPPENAFTPRMIPPLAAEGVEWVLVDNLHMDRACRGYPYSGHQKIPPPNAADQLNPPQPQYVNLSSQTNTVQAVGGVGLRPHWAEYRDPATGAVSRIVVVPTERSLGYDDSYGDRSPIPRLEQLEALNTDAAHPLLVVLAHDGDNFGASGSRYYLETMRWALEHPDRYELTTIQDYLDRFPPARTDVIHVEDGSWAGADLGDQTFSKWLGPPYKNGVIDFERGFSSDWDSWAAIVAARNWVATARAVAPAHAATARARSFLNVGQTSCYWYWDGKPEWDKKPTLAANEAVSASREALGTAFTDPVPPSVFPPQRWPYNPGSAQPGQPPSPDFTVWTLAADASDLTTVTLKVRARPGQTPAAEDFTHGGDWETLPMRLAPMTGQSALPAHAKAGRYAARVKGRKGQVVAYFVEAIDRRGNVARSDVRRVSVGDAQGGDQDLAWTPPFPTAADAITFRSSVRAALHWGVNGWKQPPRALWPPGTKPWPDGKAVETPMEPAAGGFAVKLPAVAGHDVSTIEFVFHRADGTWGADQVVGIQDAGRAWRERDRAHQKR